MKKIILVIFFLSLLSPVSWAKVGDILKVVKTPGPCPTGLAFDGQNLWNVVSSWKEKIS